MNIQPKKSGTSRSPFPFKRRTLLVRVHDDDRQAIFDLAKTLNEMRKSEVNPLQCSDRNRA